MDLSEAHALLDPAPLALETGYERLASGVLHVACRTELHGCTGEMFEWWFRFRPNTQQYIWWHPADHVSSKWAEAQDGTHIGSIHLVEEHFSGSPAEKLAIQFRHPHEYFDAAAYDEARDRGAISAAVCGRVGMGDAPERTGSGEILGGRLLHMGRDTPSGMTLRSHFYLGEDMPAQGHSAEGIKAAFPDAFGKALLMHCYNEFTFLSRFLPSLYIAEHRDSVKVRLPW